jgi:hypothetical protein
MFFSPWSGLALAYLLFIPVHPTGILAEKSAITSHPKLDTIQLEDYLHTMH